MSSGSEDGKEMGGDIDIPADQMNEFFFMNSDEEQMKYGASTKASMAMAGSILKDTKQEQVS